MLRIEFKVDEFYNKQKVCELELSASNHKKRTGLKVFAIDFNIFKFWYPNNLNNANIY